MKRAALIGSIVLIVNTLICLTCSAQDTIEKVIDNGEDGARFVCVLLAEGYTAAESEKFKDDYKDVISDVFSSSPWKEYKSFINFYTIFTPSKQSGADHPSQNIYVDTAFDATFDSYGVSRLLTANDGKAFDAVAQIPSFDAVFILVNDDTYGGSAGATIVFSSNQSAGEIALHEAGHFIGRLADEYETAYVADPNVAVMPNITSETEIESIPWKDWIGPETPLPTPETITDTIGLFEGAGYATAGIYRPKHICKMRMLGAPYCEVCAEALIRTLYNFVQPVDTFGPAEEGLTITDKPLSLWIEPMQVIDGTYEVIWEFDGEIINNYYNLSYVLNPAALANGAHTIRVWFKDTTPMVRTDAEELLTFQHTWRVNRTECSRHVSGVITNKYHNAVANARITALPSSLVAYTDENGTFEFNNLPCGTYTISVNAPGFEKTEKEISIIGDDQTDLNIILNEAGPLYTITGTVWGRTTENVTINVSGTVSAQFQTNNVKNFTLPSLPSGNYIIMPKAAGYRFFPDQRILTIRERTPRRISFFAIKVFVPIKINTLTQDF
jgi:hypothetical protein